MEIVHFSVFRSSKINVVLCPALWQADSGFFCEGYSSDEDVLLKEEFRGNIVKQGCLLKQVKQKATKSVTVFLFFILFNS